MSDLAINEAQAQWLSSQGYMTHDALNQALYHCRSQTQYDLCGWLEQHGLLSSEQARITRQAVQASPQFGALPQSQDFLKTQATPLSVPDSDALKTLKTSLGPNALQIMQSALADRYLIEKIAGQGGMGTILKAYRLTDQEPVAVKVLSESATQSLEAKRFQREARLLQSLNHENIARVFEYGIASQIPYFVMEWLDGPDLEEKIRAYFRGQSEAFTLEDLTLFLADVADALAYCHSEGLIHRDIKPSNILILSNGHAKLIDFGLVKRDKQVMDSHSLTLSKSDEALGTPAFMAPEQVDPKGDFGTVCPATDVWGLGTTLFYALTGSPPYEGETITNLYIKLLTQ
ncbi:MAG: serine/threonine-protein kinase, partial [Planctomycetota bacterium]|nr:serine/threonine-protein kinase [Planctomycetota bacterium]